MKVFCDLHHADLYYSLQLLFEKRFGWEMYRPIGLEWQQQGFWKVYNHPATAQQYLSLDQTMNRPIGLDGPFPDHELMNKNYRFEDGIYYVSDPSKNKIQRAITLDKFKEMEIDILISSIPAHIHPYNNLIKLYQPTAKHIFQVGNAWTNLPGVQNILASTTPFHTNSDINICFYHQEFDLDVYQYHTPTSIKQVGSYIHYMQELSLLAQYRYMLNDWTFKTYGGGMEGNCHSSQQVADIMRDSGFTWHVKPGGDGYGHILHNSYACGRPAIIKSNYYTNKIGSYLLEDLVTCVDISSRSIDDNVSILRKLSQPEEHIRLCENAYQRFCNVVNFDKEEQQIREFLEKLK